MIAKIEELEETVSFLAKVRKDEVCIASGLDGLGVHSVRIEYIYGCKVKCAVIHWVWSCELVKVDEDNIIVCSDKNRYYNIAKATAKVIEIPKPAFVLEKELAEKKASAKKKAEKSK